MVVVVVVVYLSHPSRPAEMVSLVWQPAGEVAGKVPTFQWSGGLPAACADFSLRAAWQQVRRFLRIKLTAVLAVGSQSA